MANLGTIGISSDGGTYIYTTATKTTMAVSITSPGPNPHPSPAGILFVPILTGGPRG